MQLYWILRKYVHYSNINNKKNKKNKKTKDEMKQEIVVSVSEILTKVCTHLKHTRILKTLKSK